ncbi:MAG: dihydroorotate dehydrogenase electron transfer subunit, partial [Nitrospirae bacterium]|nr:dihydroorotate dehydrogenase electron transfer subunit [Nitrospirota bacterium]
NAYDPLLRRPFSVYRQGEGWVEILYKVVGKGTAAMAALRGGVRVDLIGPLGKGFPTPRNHAEVLLVAGGVGIPPISLLAEEILRMKPDQRVRLYLGGKSRSDLPALERFQALGVQLTTTTEDGSFGAKGLVTEPLERDLASLKTHSAVVYACGPMPMLQAVGRMAMARKLTCYLSIEERMGCGLGACLGCVVRTKNSPVPQRVCTEGPVFEAGEIIW